MTKRAQPIRSPHCYSLVGEKWREIPTAPGYWASNFGRIASGPLRTSLGRVLAQQISKNKDRPSVKVNEGSGAVRREVHRLVCLAFNGLPPTDKHEAAHWDGDCKNNRSENLRWATKRENEDDKIRHGTIPRGIQRPEAKLTECDVMKLREERRLGVSSKKLAQHFGIRSQTVDQIARGDRWAHLPFDGKREPVRGSKHIRAKLTESHIPEIRMMLTDGYSEREVAKRFNVRPGTIWAIKVGKTWGHVS